MADDQTIVARMAAARESAKHLKERADAVATANPFYKGKDINKVSSNCYDQDGKRLLPRAVAKPKEPAKASKARAPGRVIATAPALAAAPAPTSATPVAALSAGFAAATAPSPTPVPPGAGPRFSPAPPVSAAYPPSALSALSAPAAQSVPPAPASAFVPVAPFVAHTPATGVPLQFTHRTPTVLEAISMGLHPFQMYPFETFDPPLWARADPRGPPTGYRQPTFLEACQLGLHFYKASIPVWHGWRPSTTDEAVLEERRRGLW